MKFQRGEHNVRKFISIFYYRSYATFEGKNRSANYDCVAISVTKFEITETFDHE